MFKSSGTALIAIGIAVLFVSSAMSGCSFDEMVFTDVPRPVQKELGAPSRVSLKEAKVLIQEYDRSYQAKAEKLANDYRSGRNQFEGEIGQGNQILAVLESVGNDALALAIPGVATLPGGAILSSLLVGVGGVLVGRRMPSQKVKDENWEIGKKDALEIQKELKNE
jgi:hypothetical protein